MITPDYGELVKFLVQPFLDSPQVLKVDAEISPRTKRVLIRLAIEGEDKGRVFGRGGRNIQAIRTVVQAISKISGHSAYIEIYGEVPSDTANEGERHRPARPSPRRPLPSRRKSESS